MGSVNKVILVGHLGADPDLKYTPSSKAVCNLRVATSEHWKDKGGAKQEKTEWHRVTVWGDLAENCSKYLAKGRSVYVEGRLETRSYEKGGVTMYSTDIVASQVVFLGGGEKSEEQKVIPLRSGPPPANSGPPSTNAQDDDIPF